MKERHIYEVRFSKVIEWNDEHDYPKNEEQVVEINSKDPHYVTTNAVDAYNYFLKCEEVIHENMLIELAIAKIEIDDSDWSIITNKKTLEYSDYSDHCKDIVWDVLAFNANFEGHSNSFDRFIDELLIYQSEFFNMRAVCERAKVNYSTFRGFKSNGKSISSINEYTAISEPLASL